jgi:seryl-tRNA synthetase
MAEKTLESQALISELLELDRKIKQKEAKLHELMGEKKSILKSLQEKYGIDNHTDLTKAIKDHVDKKETLYAEIDQECSALDVLIKSIDL